LTSIDAFHLPGLTADDIEKMDIRAYPDFGVELRVPVLRPGAVRRACARLVESRDALLADLPASAIIDAIDRAAARFVDPADPLRTLAKTALPAVTRYSPGMIDLILDRMAAGWRAPALHAVLEADLGGAAVLEGFVHRPGTRARTRAFGPRLAFHIFAGNVPGVAVTSIVRSLLVRAATFGKSASGEPVLPALFARALREETPALAHCLAVTTWPGGSEPFESEALEAADTVVVYGGERATAAVRGRVRSGVKLVEHGPRLSVGLVSRETLDADAVAGLAGDVARAVATFDQQGCVSPHLIHVETGGEVTPRDFARMLAESLGALETELPRGRLDPAEAIALHEARAAAEFRAIAGDDVEVFEVPTALVLYDGDPAFEASCLNRVVRVKPVESLSDVPRLLAPAAGALQSAAIACPPERLEALAGALARAGVMRITTFASLPWPPPTWHHDGSGPLAELLHWVDIES
jgi:hypothetical protein